MRQALHTTDWETLLIRDVEEKTHLLPSTLLAFQSQFVPHRTYLTKATDTPWFGFSCRRLVGGEEEKTKRSRCRKQNMVDTC